MTTVREWKNAAGDVVGVVYEGVLVNAATATKCASYDFDGVEWNNRYSAIVSCDANIVPAQGRTRDMFGHLTDDWDEAWRYVEAYIPLANAYANLTTDKRIARIEAWDTPGAITAVARARIRRTTKRLFGKPGGNAKMLLTDADLSPGFTFALLRTAYLWRMYGVMELRFFAKEPDICEFKRLREAVEWYRALVAESSPAVLRKHAQDWLRYDNLPDPLTITIPT